MLNDELAREIYAEIIRLREDFDYTAAVVRHADSVKSQIRVSSSRITVSFIIHMRKWGACNARRYPRTRRLISPRARREMDDHCCYPIVKRVSRDHACVISRAIVQRATHTPVRLAKCEILLFKVLNLSLNCVIFYYFARKCMYNLKFNDRGYLDRSW